MIAAAGSGGCAGASASSNPAEVAPPPTLHGLSYVFRVDDELAHMRVELCFDGAPPARLVTGVQEAFDYLGRVEWVKGEERGTLSVEASGIVLGALPEGACVSYRVALASAASSYGGLFAQRLDNALVSQIGLWLWRPPARPPQLRVSARFETPSGVDVQVPWPRHRTRYRLDESAFRFRGYAVLGRFERERIAVPGALLDVAIAGELPLQTRAHVRPWLQAAGHAAAALGGRFPTESMQVIVLPAAASSRPVRFGMALRGGGPAVLFLLPVNADIDALREDWVAVHEFTHHRHPFVRRDDAWLSEGIATYYQEVLAARAGLKPVNAAWNELHDGFERGSLSGTGRALRAESRGMFSSGAFERVYWAGAAIALLADVELRRSSKGRVSLDTAMQHLTRCCARSGRIWSAQEMLAELDQGAGSDIFTRLATEHLTSREFPDLERVYRTLGLEPESRRVELTRNAPAKGVRQAIMRPVHERRID